MVIARVRAISVWCDGRWGVVQELPSRRFRVQDWVLDQAGSQTCTVQGGVDGDIELAGVCAETLLYIRDMLSDSRGCDLQTLVL
jgi:hypothetical protein